LPFFHNLWNLGNLWIKNPYYRGLEPPGNWGLCRVAAFVLRLIDSDVRLLQESLQDPCLQREAEKRIANFAAVYY